MKYILILLVISFASCSFPAQKYNNLIHLQKGQDYQKFTKDHEDYYDADETYKLVIDGTAYQVIKMKIQTERIEIFRPGQAGDPRKGLSRDRSKSIREHTPFYCVFEKEKLVSWGFGYEIKRTDNQKLVELINQIKKIDDK